VKPPKATARQFEVGDAVGGDWASMPRGYLTGTVRPAPQQAVVEPQQSTQDSGGSLGGRVVMEGGKQDSTVTMLPPPPKEMTPQEWENLQITSSQDIYVDETAQQTKERDEAVAKMNEVLGIKPTATNKPTAADIAAGVAAPTSIEPPQVTAATGTLPRVGTASSRAAAVPASSSGGGLLVAAAAAYFLFFA